MRRFLMQKIAAMNGIHRNSVQNPHFMWGFFLVKKIQFYEFFLLFLIIFNVHFVNLLSVNVEMHKYTFLFMCKYPKCEKVKKCFAIALI